MRGLDARIEKLEKATGTGFAVLMPQAGESREATIARYQREHADHAPRHIVVLDESDVGL